MNSTYNIYKSSIDNFINNINYKNVPDLLKSAMSYSLNLPCKRVRAVLLLSAYNLIMQDFKKALPYAAAIEMIHCYSLIHDDLPAMDNDDFRRGMPSNHNKFGEDIAILAGDGLLNYAHEILLDYCVDCDFSKNSVLAIREISRRAGVTGMIAGQIVDITSSKEDGNAEILEYIHTHKTADLIIASVSAGLLFAGADDNQLRSGKNYAYHLGMAFQIIDDILDFVGNSEIIGKTIGKDLQNEKLSWVTLYGLEKSKEDARNHTNLACKAISEGFSNSEFLQELAVLLLKRIN